MVVTYQPHGLSSTYGGTSTDKEDVYWIYYMPITTKRGEANGYDFDGFVMFATQDADEDGTPDAVATIVSNGTFTVTANNETEITDISYISIRADDL